MNYSQVKLLSLVMLLFFLQELISQNASKVIASYVYGDQMTYNPNEFRKLEGDLVLEINQYDTSEIRSLYFYNYSRRDTIIKSFAGYLINNTISTKNIGTQDRSLIMRMEAQDSMNNWRPIEYWEMSGCGNSYSNPLKLQGNKLVVFRVPIYSGEIQTTFRLSLIGPSYESIFSDEFKGYVEKEQLYRIIESDESYFWNMDSFLNDPEQQKSKN